jgi:hypothetical protein
LVDFAKLPEFLDGLGFTSVTFCYPLTHLASNFLGFSDSEIVNHTRAELIEAFEKVKVLKKKFLVVNPTPCDRPGHTMACDVAAGLRTALLSRVCAQPAAAVKGDANRAASTLPWLSLVCGAFRFGAHAVDMQDADSADRGRS